MGRDRGRLNGRCDSPRKSKIQSVLQGSNRMRILAIYRHYWPDATPYARLLRAILEDQVTQGKSATVFTAQPGYNDVVFPRQPQRETLGGVDVQRIRLLPERKHMHLLRAINYLYFLFRAMLHVLIRRRYDLVVANTHPPVLMGVALRLIRRLTGIPFVLHCQDIHPESAVLSDQLRGGRIARWLQRVDTNSCVEAERVVTLSDDMKQTLRRRKGNRADNITVINNFALDVYEPAQRLPKLFDDSAQNPFRVLFAGNMGIFQDLPRLVEAAHVLSAERDIHFIFMGTGAELRKLMQLATDLINETVFFEPFQPAEIASACMRRANLGVVSLRAGVFHVAYPSKTMTYLAAGCPLLLLAERNSQLAEDIVGNNYGYVPEEITSEGIAQTIRRARDDRRRWTAMARHELVTRSEAFYGKEKILSCWRELFSDIDRRLTGESILLPINQVTEKRCAA